MLTDNIRVSGKRQPTRNPRYADLLMCLKYRGVSNLALQQQETEEVARLESEVSCLRVSIVQSDARA